MTDETEISDTNAAYTLVQANPEFAIVFNMADRPGSPGRKGGKPKSYEMFVATPNPLLIATFFGGWEVVLMLGVVMILFVAKRLPEIMSGLRSGLSEVHRELGGQAHDAGKSAGGIFGKPAAEALTPDNHTAELYDMWISDRWWAALNPTKPFEKLPLKTQA